MSVIKQMVFVVVNNFPSAPSLEYSGAEEEEGEEGLFFCLPDTGGADSAL